MSRDRDRILEQALKHELRAAGTPADAHLDAETLAAWVDDALDANASAACEDHVSNCSRCQALVATMARGTSSTASTAGTPGTQGSFPLWKWWLAPIAAGVTAVTLWMVIPEEPRQLAQSVPQLKDSKAADGFAPAVPAPTEPAQQVAESESRLGVDKLAAAAREDRQQNQAVGERKEEATVQLRDRAASADAAVAPEAPAPPAAVALERSAPAAPAEIGALQKSARAGAPIEIATLDPSLGWRIVGGRIERSDNGGRTWTAKRQNAGEELVAGSAPSSSVAWFVGRAGLVLLTTDSGATFTDVSLAEPLDLASVAATDARNAMIFSVVGRRFRTDDGGRTWRPY